jgi:adenylate cyclase
MAQEIERRFLVKGNAWKEGVQGIRYRQGYLSSQAERTVRVREAGDKAYLTIKGLSAGASRSEYEYSIPLQDAREMLDTLCEQPLIDKVRYKIPHKGHIWEVDVFAAENSGLVVAEIELQSENETFELPDWVSDEVTYDARYFNSSLSKYPFRNW